MSSPTLEGSSSTSLPFQSRSGLARRTSAAGSQSAPSSAGPIHVDVDPPPKAKPVFQVLAFILILFFTALQFLPATHFRDPSNPFRGEWIRIDEPHRSALHHQTSNISLEAETANVHIVSWISCLDLRVLAVLVNSTLTSSRYPGNLNFHFFLPESGEEKVSFHKLKVLFPNTNIEIIGRREIKEKVALAVPEIEYIWPIPTSLAPFIISRIKPSLGRFIYMLSITIVKGNINELFAIDNGNYAIAAVEDCNKKLHDLINVEIINAIQRTSLKNWVSKGQYDGNACTPDLNILLLDSTRLEKDILQAILWWSNALSKDIKKDDEAQISIFLSFYNKFQKLPPSWRLGDSRGSQPLNDSNLHNFDGPKMECFASGEQKEMAGFGNNWQQHISTKSEIVLGH